MLLLDKLVGHVVPVRFLVFAAIGGLGLLVHMAVLMAGFKGAALDFPAAQAGATLVAMVFNFSVNNAMTYRDRRLTGLGWYRGLVSFMLACSVGAVANVGIANYLFGRNGGWVLAALAGHLPKRRVPPRVAAAAAAAHAAAAGAVPQQLSALLPPVDCCRSACRALPRAWGQLPGALPAPSLPAPPSGPPASSPAHLADEPYVWVGHAPGGLDVEEYVVVTAAFLPHQVPYHQADRPRHALGAVHQHAPTLRVLRVVEDAEGSGMWGR